MRINLPDSSSLESLLRLGPPGLSEDLAARVRRVVLGPLQAFLSHDGKALRARAVGPLRAYVARLNREPVGFMLALDGGDTVYCFHCGLDRERTIPSRAYFNLYYALISDAIRRGKRRIRLGAEAYPVKKKLGGVAVPNVYDFEVSHPVLRALARLVARNLSAQDGSKLDAMRA